MLASLLLECILLKTPLLLNKTKGRYTILLLIISGSLSTLGKNKVFE